MSILVTGGAGYIGTHTCVELLKEDYEVVVIDNLSNAKKEALCRVEKITGKTIRFYQDTVLNEQALEKIFQENQIDCVIHFAGLKAVGESVQQPLQYYENNVKGTISLLKVMQKYNCKNFVFSSSATVYTAENPILIDEDEPLGANNPYGRTKLFIEYILKDLYASDPTWNIAILRYFNPIGAHPSGLIGENPSGIPNNLMPYITQVAIGELEFLNVFGNDYDTPDGTGVRDYIHVCDLAYGHICAIHKLDEKPGLVIYNLGTGIGYSVLDIVHTFEKVNHVTIPCHIIERRPGDIAIYYANPNKAEREMHFKTKRTLEDMCRDSWNYQIKNPKGIL